MLRAALLCGVKPPISRRPEPVLKAPTTLTLTTATSGARPEPVIKSVSPRPVMPMPRILPLTLKLRLRRLLTVICRRPYNKPYSIKDSLPPSILPTLDMLMPPCWPIATADHSVLEQSPNRANSQCARASGMKPCRMFGMTKKPKHGTSVIANGNSKVLCLRLSVPSVCIVVDILVCQRQTYNTSCYRNQYCAFGCMARRTSDRSNETVSLRLSSTYGRIKTMHIEFTSSIRCYSDP
jgi:hypothetical protein